MRLILTLALVLCGSVADAKDLYVNAATGNDGTTYAANGIGAPWATLCRATNGATSCVSGSTNAGQAAQAGDVVHVAAGTYSAAGLGSSGRFTSPFNPANSGTLGNLITFQCASGTCTLELSSNDGPVFGCRSRDYIKWDGFTVNGVDSPSASDTGHVDIYDADGCELHNLIIVGDVNHPDTDQGNYNAVRIEASNDTVLRNSDLSNIAEEGVYGPNQAAVMLYDSNRTIIEHNYIHSVGVGVFVKGTHGDGPTQEDTTIRYNKVWDARVAGIMLLSAQGGLVYQNIIKRVTGSPQGILLFGFAAAGGIPDVPFDIDVYNNTIIGCDIGLGYDGALGVNYYTNIRSWNNIVSGGRISLGTESMATIGDTNHEHNIYRSPSSAVATLSGGTMSLASWKALSPAQDSAAPAASSNDPLFVDAASDDYHLQGGSYALTHGRTFAGATVPAGAYITGSEVIGIDNGTAVAPDPPTIGTATAGNTQATVSFTPPSDDGGSTITGYTATSSPGNFTGTCASSPCTVTGLTNGTPYTFTVTATNAEGTSSASSASNSVTPTASPTAPVRLRIRGENP